VADLMILESLLFILSLPPMRLPPSVSQSADGLSLIFFF